MGNLTLKRILRRHKDFPEDEALHKIIENADVDKKDFDKIVDLASKQEAYDKKK